MRLAATFTGEENLAAAVEHSGYRLQMVQEVVEEEEEGHLAVLFRAGGRTREILHTSLILPNIVPKHTCIKIHFFE